MAARDRTPSPSSMLPLAAPLLCGIGLASAQSPATSARDRTTTLPRVEVVGSHIRRVDLETSQPVLVLDRADLLRTGLTNLGEILQQLPQHVADLNSDFNNGGNGETRVDLRNLGAKRTLVLLNGRRYVNTLDGAVDVASIPLPIVDRVEILTDGGSAIYGSDAIAGVINIVTRHDYAGSEASVYYASNEHGDGERRAADITWGRQGERGGIALNLSYADQQPIWAGDRTISSVPVYGLPANSVSAGASQQTPYGRYGFGPFGENQPDGEPGLLTFDPGLGTHRLFDPEHDSYNFAPENYLRTPYERTALFAQVNYAFDPRLSLHSQLLLHQRDSSQELAPTPIFQFGAGGDPNTYNIASENLFNPFGQPVTFFTFRPVVQPRRFEQDVRTHYFNVGLDGVMPIGKRDFDWNATWIDARTRQDETIIGGYDLNRLGRGVGPSFRDSGGTARCGTPSAPVADCVPLDFLHGKDGFDQAMYDSIVARGTSRETRRLRDATANLSGRVVDLPAGPLTMAAGLEYRKESGRIELDPLLASDANEFGGISAEPTSGDIRVREAYVEFNLPLLAKRPWAESLELDIAVRHSDYSTFGDTTNGKFGLSWRPHPDWLLRGTWSQSYRAPSTSELFAVSSQTQTTSEVLEFIDPCFNAPTGLVAERCRAAGVPLGQFDPALGPVVQIGSNPDLQPESARNRVLGLVWSPAAVPGLDATLDWWWIELRDTIDVLDEFSLTVLCYEEGLQGACDQLQRDPATGALVHIDARLHNYGTYEVEGYDLAVNYAWGNAWGDFRLRWDSVYLTRYLKELPRDAPPFSAVGNYFNSDPGWRLRWLLSLDWQRATLGATARLRYYPSLDETCAIAVANDRADLCDRPDFDSPAFGGAEHVIDSRTYLDLQLRWEFGGRSRVTLGVENAFDRDPPVSYSLVPNSYDPSYDVPGRFWYVSFWQQF